MWPGEQISHTRDQEAPRPHGACSRQTLRREPITSAPTSSKLSKGPAGRRRQGEALSLTTGRALPASHPVTQHPCPARHDFWTLPTAPASCSHPSGLSYCTCPGCGEQEPPGAGASILAGWAPQAVPRSSYSPTCWSPWSSPAFSCGSPSCQLQCPASVALVANLVAAVLSFTCFPVSTKGVRAPAPAAPPGRPEAGVFDLKAISRLLLRPGVLPVFLVKVVSGFPSGLFMVMFSIISMDFFQLDAAEAGYLMSFFGVLQMVIQGLVIGRLSSRFSEGALLRASVLVFVVVGPAMALMSNVFHFCFLMPGLVFSLGTLSVVTDSMLTKAVPAADTGTMLGLCASVQPLTRTVGPTVGGLLYRSFGVPIFGHVQFATNVLVLLVLWRQPLPQKTDKVL
ncbi:solute carrier family 22 member 18 isoform X2 [Meles meles]|uniref:solute carrier family 22 member 18 isoform X2 n=1 Tax=Meles meles TaxID=9662 RepID=UPI001E69AED7|nr:solute carrier family 22 member 18 isoform X2 [Meles meles]